ncbi:enoyl-CoA hydratase/isomerase family protein [Caldiplasma sukawensis]
MKNIKTEERGRILIVKMARENPLNPLNIEMLEEIGEVLKDEKKVAIITGENKAFSAGADINIFLNLDKSTAYSFARKGHDVMDQISERSMPVIASIHGYALGGGFELALACDFRVAHPKTQMGLPEITLGIIPGFGGTQRLKEIAGRTLAFRMISFGERIDAQKAFEYGIIDEVSENYFEASVSLAERLCNAPFQSLSYIKKLVYDRRDEKYDLEKEYFANLFGTPDQIEGAKAFFEKRKPQFNKNI